MHLLMQPVVAQQLLTDELVTKLGFLGRILMCWPESLIGTRLHKEPPPQARQSVADFTTRVLTILETPIRWWMTPATNSIRARYRSLRKRESCTGSLPIDRDGIGTGRRVRIDQAVSRQSCQNMRHG